MTKCYWLRLEGLEACILLEVDQLFIDSLGAVFGNRGYEVLDFAPSTPFAKIVFSNKKYTVSSPFMDKPAVFGDRVNTLCLLVVELAWAQLREQPELLCLHGAAVEINNRLVVFPSTRRAGKSTLTVAMMAAGHKVFTDDFLPLTLDENNIVCGVSQGVSPRLRLPAPEQIGSRAAEFVDNNAGIANKQYKYVVPDAGSFARFGETAPLGALVFLERKVGCAASIVPVSKSEALTALIKQNFARAMNAGSILRMLSSIAGSAPAYRLQFDHVDSAIEQLSQHFQQWDGGPVTVEDMSFEEAPEHSQVDIVTDWETAPLVQSGGVETVELDGKRYLSGAGGRNIVFLNEVAAGIWQLLFEPTTVTEITELVVAAFPGQPPEELARDVKNTVGSFVNAGLIGYFDSHVNVNGISEQVMGAEKTNA